MFRILSRLFGGRGPKWSAEERELFRQVALAEPDDPRPRLRLADALEQRGEPMGEYIRLTHESESLPEGDPRRKKLEGRLQALLDANGRAWCQPATRLGLAPEIMGHFYPPLWMTHGALDRLELDREGVLPGRAPELFEALPGLRVLSCSVGEPRPGPGEGELHFYQPDVAGVARLPQMEQIGELRLTNLVLSLDDLRAIATSPHLKNLRVLRVQGLVGPEGARLVASSRSLTRLRELELRTADVGDEGAQALAGSPNLAGLVCLELPGNNPDDCENSIGDAGAAALARSPHLTGVRTLDLSWHRLGPEGGRELAASPHLRPAVLNLTWNRLGPDGARALAGSAWLAGVSHLRLARNGLGAGAAILAGSPHLRGLTVLDLSENAAGDEALAALAGSPAPAGLTELSLGNNDIGAAGARALAASGTLRRLTKLDLAGNRVGDDGARALAASPVLATLTTLNLNGNRIGPDGIRALAGSPHVRGLTELWLWDNPLGPEGAQALARSPNLTKLDRLYLPADLGERAEQQLRDRFGDALTVGP